MKRQKNLRPLFVFLAIIAGIYTFPSQTFSQSAGSYQSFLPFVSNQIPTSEMQVHIPFFDGEIQPNETAIFWFGRVYETDNYSDVRVGYNDTFLYVRLAIFDRQVWYDTTPSVADLTDWDSAALYLNLDGNAGNIIDSSSYAFLGQLSWSDPNQEAVYQGNNGQWLQSTIPFSSYAGWQSDGSGINDDSKPDRGWSLTYNIPFSSLGLSSPPSSATTWGMAIVLYDRDDAAGNIQISNKVWPPEMSPTAPGTWGQLSFGQSFGTLASQEGNRQPDGTTIIRHGNNGVVVPDGMVGGGFWCGEDLSPVFHNWGEANYTGAPQINVQDQHNLADWPCFSKYYITFPLDSLPDGVQITSATLTMYHFSNAGNGGPNIPTSLLQVMTVGDDWNENTLTWNNAPLALENISQLWVPPNFTGNPIARTWDLGSAVAEALQTGQPLRLVIYSADSDQHSGKYFISSNAGPSSATNRPTLTVNWVNP